MWIMKQSETVMPRGTTEPFLVPKAARIRAESLVSQVANLLYKADKAIYGVKWTLFFCLFSFAKRVRKNEKEIRCGSIVTVEKTHTTMTTENNNNKNSTHEHRVQTRMFLISNLFSFIVPLQQYRMDVSLLRLDLSLEFQSKHGASCWQGWK